MPETLAVFRPCHGGDVRQCRRQAAIAKVDFGGLYETLSNVPMPCGETPDKIQLLQNGKILFDRRPCMSEGFGDFRDIQKLRGLMAQVFEKAFDFRTIPHLADVMDVALDDGAHVLQLPLPRPIRRAAIGFRIAAGENPLRQSGWLRRGGGGNDALQRAAQPTL